MRATEIDDLLHTLYCGHRFLRIRVTIETKPLIFIDEITRLVVFDVTTRALAGRQSHRADVINCDMLVQIGSVTIETRAVGHLFEGPHVTGLTFLTERSVSRM
jgi:hypothetical protein